ncbi:RNA-binding protein MEX3B [Anas platyrhynchos]|uniref:RNA-binding protein MEX3B n=1 Tax=Anas platyrhynchos TaxID=8839 RepID=R0KRT4_ANAPL|nr:RNA-binding protein MEX3B [Anas platyrhynchos]
MTECVPVPSSEHVAEIVGRQGCKIKALRAKTNTYIKTPVRGEEPLFVVTGRKEDVAMARREIISAAEHFSMIRASRNKNTALNGTVPGPPNLPGQTTIQSEVIAALVPCGHNLFCMECANRICEKTEPQCPVCHSAVTQAIRIFS